jgi:putative thioredoxin
VRALQNPAANSRATHGRVGGKAMLIKVDIDKHQKIAQSVQIAGVPAVFMVKEGEMVDSLVGAVDDARLNEFFGKIE